jgi:hypothetical protein
MTVISLITLTMLLMVILSPSQDELHEDAELVARLELRRRTTEQQVTYIPPVPAPAPAPVRPHAPMPHRQPAQRRPVFGAPVHDPQQMIYGAQDYPTQEAFPQQSQRSTTRPK